MFNLFKRKKIDPSQVKDYKDAIKLIKFFIATLEFDKALKAIWELEKKELNSYKKLIEELEKSWKEDFLEKEKKYLTKKLNQKQNELKKLKQKAEDKKEKYEKQKKEKELKISFKTIKREIDILLWKKQTYDAFWLLKDFLNKYPWEELVINFYNKQKEVILKQIEKQKKLEEKRLKENARLEALKLIWQTANIDIEKKENNKEKSFFEKLKYKLNFYKKIKLARERKRLIDEIDMLLKQENEIKETLANKKLANIHKWLIKELSMPNLLGYEFYWKILWADKISGDAFWFKEQKKSYIFFIWDATGHWVRAWFIVALLSRLFNKFIWKWNLQKLVYEVNNWLKQDLKSMNFITAIFFEILKDNLNKINFVWLGHEPILVYRNKEKIVEKLRPGWLAAWIRLIKKTENVKIHNIELNSWDILLTYSDWLIETKSPEWEYYWIDRLANFFLEVAKNEKNTKKIYNYLINDIKNFRWWSRFDDDVTILILKRDNSKDIIKDKKQKEEIIKEILKEKNKFWIINNNDIKKIKWKTKSEIEKELEKIEQDKKIESIIHQLKSLWLTWEILKLKSEAKRYIKEGYVHPKINYYLKKAIDNYEKYRIKQKEKKMKMKYDVLLKLYQKGDYDTVIREIEDIIAKDWNI